MGVIVMMPLVMIVMLYVGVIVMMPLVMVVMLNVCVIVMMMMLLVMIVMLGVGVLVMMPLVMIVSGCHHGYDVSTPAQPLQHLCVCLWGAFLWQVC